MFDTTHFHPMLVHFPIAIIMVGVLADFSSLLLNKEKCLSTMGLYLEVLGMLAAIAAFVTGYFLTGDVLEGAGVNGSRHELFATLTLVTIIFATVFRLTTIFFKKESSLKYFSLGAFLLAAVFVGITGYYGGMIVFGNM